MAQKDSSERHLPFALTRPLPWLGLHIGSFHPANPSTPSEPDGVPVRGLGVPVWKAGNASPRNPSMGSRFCGGRAWGTRPRVPHAGAVECSGEGRRQSREGKKVHAALSKRRWKQAVIWVPLV